MAADDCAHDDVASNRSWIHSTQHGRSSQDSASSDNDADMHPNLSFGSSCLFMIVLDADSRTRCVYDLRDINCARQWEVSGSLDRVGVSKQGSIAGVVGRLFSVVQGGLTIKKEDQTTCSLVVTSLNSGQKADDLYCEPQGCVRAMTT